MLAARPCRNTAAKVLLEQGKLVTVVVKNKRPRYHRPPISWFVPYRPEKQIELDEVGSHVWRWCDGQNSVEQVIDLFKDEYGLSFHEAKAAVINFLQNLIKRGILAIAIEQ